MAMKYDALAKHALDLIVESVNAHSPLPQEWKEQLVLVSSFRDDERIFVLHLPGPLPVVARI